MKSNLIFQFFTCSFFLLLLACTSNDLDTPPPPPEDEEDDRIVETFKIISNGKSLDAKIYIPSAFETNKELPAIYLIDVEEVVGLEVAYHEFDRVIDGIEAVEGSDALVITLVDFFPE